jgi:hypothetical protein
MHVRPAGHVVTRPLNCGVRRRAVHRALAEAIQLFERGLEQCHRAEDRKQIERYLAELGAILAAAVLGQDIISRLAQAQRLFGHSWLIDQAPFEAALEKWREFKAEYEEFAVRGMTVNERLHAFSLLESYDQAVAAQDSAEVRRILEAVHVDEQSIVHVISEIRGDA